MSTHLYYTLWSHKHQPLASRRGINDRVHRDRRLRIRIGILVVHLEDACSVREEATGRIARRLF